MLLLLLAAEGSELPNALAAGRGHRTAVSHARVPAADNNGRPSLPAGPYNLNDVQPKQLLRSEGPHIARF